MPEATEPPIDIATRTDAWGKQARGNEPSDLARLRAPEWIIRWYERYVGRARIEEKDDDI